MRGKALFVGASLGVSLALFFLIAWMTSAGLYTPLAIGYVAPAVAVMACALGVGWRRKMTAISLTLVGYILFDLLARVTGLQALAGRPLAGGFAEQSIAAVGIVYALVPLIYPLAALVLFVGRSPSILWTPMAEGTPPRKSSGTARGRG